jgi:UDP-N-acetylmuramoylalanine--D-glutamate ligase
MDINSLSKKRIGILGYGSEGQSTARYLKRHGITPVLFDKDPKIKSEGFICYSGPDYLEHLAEVEILFRSPGFWRLEPRLLKFEKEGGLITSQANFFFENCPCAIIGVTGTKGKGTTTTLAYEMAKKSGKEAYLTGNIGATEPLDFLDSLSEQNLVFYELSSFQLQDLKKSPHIGVVLMVTADHLDYHESIEEYRSAKNAITEFQTTADFAIINKDFPTSESIGIKGKGRKLWISHTKVDFGILIDNANLYAKGLGEYGVPDGLLLKSSELTLRGLHNLQNIAASLLAGTMLGLPLKIMLETAKKFPGLEHRLEFVTEKNGVQFYNDSFSTTPETAIAAISAFDQPLFLILGGSEKFLDYTNLAEEISKQTNIATVFLIGQTAARMEETLRKAKFNPDKISSSAKTMEEIFTRLHFLAQPGSVVLLSPATASFGMFKDYKERGQIFKQLATDW